ncbi:MAG: heavy metal translocating P-type ATPase [Bacillota bacterium]|nr:heavy metal translocating P-type ATPase [Bacillota bacterium]
MNAQTQNHYDVGGMTCSACQARVDRAVRSLEGVEEVSVNLLTGRMLVSGSAAPEAVIAAVEDAGYTGTLRTPTENTTSSAQIPQTKPKDPLSAVREAAAALKRRFFLSLIFMLPLACLAMGPMLGLPLPAVLDGPANTVSYALAQFLLALPVLYLNRSYFKNGYRALWHRGPNMDSLIAIGSTAALLYGIVLLFQASHALGAGDLVTAGQIRHQLYFESSAMILTLITLGKWLEARSKAGTGQAMQKLLDLTPRTALRERPDGDSGSTCDEIPIAALTPGDIVQVRPGSAIPADGIVVSGDSGVDESAITGESLPVDKLPGDTVIGGTMNTHGQLRVRVTRLGEDSTLAGILRLMEEAGSSRAPIARLADRISGIFVPIVLAIALVTLLTWLASGAAPGFALQMAISVLVISCPCALGLATPVAIMAGTGRGAGHGILIRSGEALETLAGVHTIVLDKTGTLTSGDIEVTHFHPLSDDDPTSLLAAAAALESGSEHLLAAAIVRYADREAPDTRRPTVTRFTAHAGLGVSGHIEGSHWLAGNARFLEEQGIDITDLSTQSQQLSSAGQTPIYFARDGRVVLLMALADQLRPESPAAVQELKALGRQVVMLTGDHAPTARAIAAAAGIEHYIADVLPADKEAEIRRLQDSGHRVAMVGDGINDAPALMRADVGIAIGAGTDVALESADVILLRSDPRDIARAIRLSQATLRNIRQNLFWAFLYNSLGIPLAAGVFYPAFGWQLNPMIAAAAMSLSSLFVVTNALRLRNQSLEVDARLRNQSLEVDARLRNQSLNDIPAKTQTKETPKMRKYTLDIVGMTCPHCERAVRRGLEGIPGTSEVTVDRVNGQATLLADDRVSDVDLDVAVSIAGFSITAMLEDPYYDKDNP